MSGFQLIWQKILNLGDVSGKVLTLVTLPSAIFTIYYFFNEIGDTLSQPVVTAKVENVGLRCGPYIDKASIPDVRPNAFMHKECAKSDLSAWVKLNLHNEDSINRTLASVAFRITFPKNLGLSDRPVTWTETRVVSHIIEGDIQTVQMWPWRAMLFTPGQVVPLG